MLYIAGLGLADEKDITFKGLEIVKQCDQVFIEAYTSLLSFGLSSDGLSTLEFQCTGKLVWKPVTVTDRKTVEEKADHILTAAAASDFAFLVVGDPFGATTHTDLVVQATKLGIDVESGLENVSDESRVFSLYMARYTHEGTDSGIFVQTYLLFSASLESLSGRTQYEPPRYMSINTAIEQLLEAEENPGESADKTHPVEEETLDCYKINKEDHRRQEHQSETEGFGKRLRG
ncbi:unnamed protein product [Prunus armeniaca]